MKTKITERGWAGHFIAAQSCRFRRNTLLERGDKRIIVSTVGSYFPMGDGKIDTIGFNRWYETMAFEAQKNGPYWDADVTKQISFHGEWGIFGNTEKDLPDDADNKANEMHERIVKEFVEDENLLWP